MYCTLIPLVAKSPIHFHQSKSSEICQHTVPSPHHWLLLDWWGDCRWERRSVAVSLPVKNICSQGTEDAWLGKTSKAILASVGYDFPFSYFCFGISTCASAVVSETHTNHQSTRSVLGVTSLGMSLRWRRSSTCQSSSISFVIRLRRWRANSAMGSSSSLLASISGAGEGGLREGLLSRGRDFQYFSTYSQLR